MNQRDASRTVGLSVVLILVGVIVLAGIPGGLPQAVFAQGTGSQGETFPQATVGTAFTYQGQLTDGGSPANGSYDFQFQLYDVTSGGSPLATLARDDVALSDGLFTVRLDFGPLFDGAARYLAIGVRAGSSTGTYTSLSPRQDLTPAPYALALPGLWTEQNGTSPNLVGGYGGNTVAGGVVGATIGGGGNSSTLNMVSGNYGTVGGGAKNTASGSHASVGGGNGNIAGADNATVAGGSFNHASGESSAIGGGHGNTASKDCATIGGGSGNTASDGVTTIAGGSGNTAGSEGATVGGGTNNQALWEFSTVSGGYGNTALAWATVGGGTGNTASEDHATVGGGSGNSASHIYATIGGGSGNAAGGRYATVPGGLSNTANGDYSFAAGQRAQASHTGSFVLADSTDADFASVRDDSLRVRFNGGATFVLNDGYWVRLWKNGTHLIDTNAGGSPPSGAHLTTGGTWTNASDRHIKENLKPVDGQQVLSALAGMPIQTWNYRAEGPSIRRMGPTSQDFYAAFGLGEDDLHIATVDADGVALAAIQGLEKRSREQAARIQALQDENAALRQALDDLAARLAALEVSETEEAQP